MKNIFSKTVFLILILGYIQIQAQFYNQGAEVTIQAGATVTVEGNFENDAGSNFKNSGTIVIKKNVTNNQNMSNDFGGYWIFNGNTLQKISGTAPIWINALNINNPAGFLLQNSLIINKQMEFSDGIMNEDLSSNTVIFNKNAQPAAPLPTDASHINGGVIKLGESQTFKYPIGNGIKYQPIEVAFEDNGNENGLLANYYAIDAGTAPFGSGGTETTLLNKYNTKEFWDLTPINNGITKGKITLFWDSYNDSFADLVSQRRVAHLATATGKWQNEGSNAGVGTIANGSVQSNIVTNWSPFTLGTVAPAALPVRLLAFNGNKVNGNNVLDWATTEEKNASHFEIEKSIDGKAFEKIGKVEASFATNENIKYEFVDYIKSLNEESLSYYRLKIVDLDGKFDYSKIINILYNTDNDAISQFYPNPLISDFANINIVATQKDEWFINHFDTMGKLLNTETKVLEKGLNKLTVAVSQKGESIFQFQNGNKIVSRKVIR